MRPFLLFLLRVSRPLQLALLGLSLLATATLRAEPTVYVSSEKDNKIYLFDGKGEPKGAIDTCQRPRHMMFSLDKKTLYVCCGNSNELGFIDLASRRMVRTMKLGESPEIFDFNSKQSVIYVSIEDDSVMAAYDMASGKELFRVPTGGEPEGIFIKDDKLAYVTSEVANMVHVIDLATRKVIKDIKVGKRPRRFLSVAGGSELWVSDELSNSVSIIDTANHSVKHRIQFKIKGVRDSDIMPVGMVASLDGKSVWVTLGRANRVAEVDVASREIKQLVLAGQRAWGIDLSADGKTLYVVNGLSDNMTLIDVSGPSARALRTVPAGRVPHSVILSR